MLKEQEKKEAYAKIVSAMQEKNLEHRPKTLKAAFNKAAELLTKDEINQVSTALLKKYATSIAIDPEIASKAYIHPEQLEQEPLKNIAITFYYLGKMREDAGLDNLPAMQRLLKEIPNMKGNSIMALDHMALFLHVAAKEMMDALDGAPLDEHGHRKTGHSKKSKRPPSSPHA